MLQGNYLKHERASSQKTLIFLNIAVRTSTLGKSARFFNKQNFHNQEDYKASKHVIQTYHLVPNVTVGYSKITVFKKNFMSRRNT